MLSPSAQAVYRAVLAEPTVSAAELGEHLGLDEPEVESALGVLIEAELLRTDPAAPSHLAPVHPRVGLARLLADAEADIAKRQHAMSEWRSSLEAIASEFEAGWLRERLVKHTDIATIQARLEQLAIGARHECISFNPGRAQHPADMEASKPLNQLALEQGVGIRCIYQSSFRLDRDTLAYARWLTDLGGQMRTIPEVPHLLVIVDAEVALVPVHPDNPAEGALEIWAPGIVKTLTEYFNFAWSMAEPLGKEPAHTHGGKPSAMTKKVLALLSSGATDEAAANRLGLSARTVRRVVSAAMADLGAQSRFQAGVEAARRGWL